MKTIRILTFSLGLSMVFTGSLVARSLNLVQNSSFETPDVDPNWSDNVGAAGWSANPSDSAPVWATTGPGQSIHNEPPGDAGSHYAGFPATTAGGIYYEISQNVAISTAGSYDLSFWVYAEYSDDTFLTASIGGTSKTYDFNVPTTDSSGSQNWIQETISGISLGSGSQTLDFSVTAGDLYLGLDDVCLAQSAVVPEPTTWMAGGLMLLPFGAGTLRKFRNRTIA